MNIVVWSKDDCQWCDQAKNLLQQRGIEYTERKLGYGWTKEQLLESIPGARTLPQITIDGVNIGGFKELKERI
jgi:glutaredoxin 3